MAKDVINRTEGLRRQVQGIICLAYERGYKDGEADAEERHKEPSVVTMTLKVDNKKTLKKAMADAVLTPMPAEIVHCRDCRWWAAPKGCLHEHGMVTVTANSFCSYGARMEE